MKKFWQHLNFQEIREKGFTWLIDFYHNLRKEFFLAQEKIKDLNKTNYELGLFHLNHGNLNDAILRFKVLSWLNPNWANPLYQMGRAYILQNKLEKAIECFQKAFNISPSLESSARLNQLSKKNIELPISLIIEDLDCQAENYEKHQKDKNCQVHELIVEKIKDIFYPILANFSVLDLGCGTGLVGRELNTLSEKFNITGVDLSPAMLEKAQNSLCYKKLLNIDINNLDDNISGNFDIIIACNSFNYIKDLKKTIEKSVTYLNKGGIYVFSVYSENDYQKTLLDHVTNYFTEKELNETIKSLKYKNFSVEKIKISDIESGYLVSIHIK